jgi:hypothetical protein
MSVANSTRPPHGAWMNRNTFDPTVCLPSRLASCQPFSIMSLAPTMTSSIRETS